MFLITAQRERRMPLSSFFCCKALRNNSTQQHTDFPEPTGPRSKRKKTSDFINAFSVSPSGLYLNVVNLIVLAKLYHALDNFWPYDSNNLVGFSVGLELFGVVGKVNLLNNSTQKVALFALQGMEKTHVLCCFVFSAMRLGCRECCLPALMALRLAAVEAAYSDADKDFIALLGR